MQVGIGFSQDKEAVRAGESAAEQAVKYSGEPNITFLFTTGDYDPAKVLTGVKNVIGSSKVVGASTYGLITRSGVLTSGVGVCSLSGPDVRAASYLHNHFPTPSYPHNDKIDVGLLLQQNRVETGTAFVFPNGFGDNISVLLRRLHDLLGPGFDYVGGGTGDNLSVCQTYQITDQGVATDGFALALLSGVDFKFGLAHSWEPMGEPMLITKAEGKRVYEIDGLPAFSRYAACLGGIKRDDVLHCSLHYPLGIPCAGGEFLIRDPLRVEDDGSMVFVTEVPSNTVATIMVPGAEGDLTRATRRAVLNTCASTGQPKFVFIFDCVSRYFLLGKSFEQELIKTIESIDPVVPVLGLLSFGEISSISGTPLFYNKCITVAVGG